MFENKRKLDPNPGDGGGGIPRDDEGKAAETPKELTAMELFIKAHNIHSPSPGVISVSLNGLSRQDFVDKANRLAGGGLVVAQDLRELGKKSEFTDQGTRGTTIRIDGYVEGSQRLSISERKTQGMASISISDAVTAHVAYNILNLSQKVKGADLFCGFMVQASDGYLQFGSQGVGIHKMGWLVPDSWSPAARDRRIAGMEEFRK